MKLSVSRTFSSQKGPYNKAHFHTCIPLQSPIGMAYICSCFIFIYNIDESTESGSLIYYLRLIHQPYECDILMDDGPLILAHS